MQCTHAATQGMRAVCLYAARQKMRAVYMQQVKTGDEGLQHFNGNVFTLL